MNRLFFTPLVMALSMTAFANVANAESTVWSMTAMTCTPTNTTAAERKYVTTAGRIKFKNNASGKITFLCPVSSVLPKGKYVVRGARTYPNSTYGKGNSLQLRRANKRSGAVDTVLSAVITQEQYPPGKKWGTITSPPKDITFDLNKYAYWVQFTISRPTGAGESPAMLSAEIARY